MSTTLVTAHARAQAIGDHGRASSLHDALAEAPAPLFVAYAAFSAFATYFCMYGYRKAFAAGTYAQAIDLGALGRVDAKVAFVVAQVLGYCLSKFAGIKLVAEMRPERRTPWLVGAVLVAEAALVSFAVAPLLLKPLCLFINGLPLGLTWGLVFGHLEGRRSSDMLGAAVCASFIVASGFAKTVGKALLGWGVTERWMPAAAGGLFLVPTLVSVMLLAQLPPPSAADEAARAKRVPMDAAARRAFVRETAFGLVTLVVAYVVLTAYRDFRDNFARELWDALGYAGAPSVMTTAELPIALGALVAVGLVMKVRDNARALVFVHGLMLAGAVTIGVSTMLFRVGLVGPAAWMVLAGLGLYVGYVPFNCVLFDRLVAALGTRSNAGFLIYLADAFGYLGSVALLFAKSFAAPKLSWLAFFERMSLATAMVGLLAFGASGVYFARHRAPPVA